VDAQTILNKLPPFDGHYELISADQSVGDIMAEVLEAHQVFAADYDFIALCFDADTVQEVCKSLYQFCKRNFKYSEQTEEGQLTMSPAAMLHLHKVDCKNYAGFCAGVLDGLNRLTERKIPWAYRFASYKVWDNTPHHVFVVVNPGENEIWLDPTPGADKSDPVWKIDKKVKVAKMAINRVSGVGDTVPGQQPVNDLLNNTPTDSPLYNAVQLLLFYGVMNTAAKVNDDILQSWEENLSDEDWNELLTARNLVEDAAIGAVAVGSKFSDDIAHWIAVPAQWVARRSFLGLVGLNGFGLASKLSHAIYEHDNSDVYYQPGQDKVYRIWYHVGGDFSELTKAVKIGRKNKAVLGVVPAVIAAWAAACATVLTALGGVISAVLKNRKTETGIDYNINPATGLPYGQDVPPIPPGGSGGTSTGIMDFVEKNPAIVIGGAVGIAFLWPKIQAMFKKKSHTA
jgi:hypothetical protein